LGPVSSEAAAAVGLECSSTSSPNSVGQGPTHHEEVVDTGDVEKDVGSAGHSIISWIIPNKKFDRQVLERIGLQLSTKITKIN
jgi:hypothetical protein